MNNLLSEEPYKTHLPGRRGPTTKEIYGEIGREAKEAIVEPFLEVGVGVKESLKRIYEVAAQPLGGEAIKPKPFGEAPFEFLGSLAGYVAALPVKVVGDLIEKSGELRREAARTLLGGPRGELGEWTEEQVSMAQAATEVTLGAMVGGGPGAGTGPANIALRSTGKGAKKIVGAYEMLAKEFRGLKKLKEGSGQTKEVLALQREIFGTEAPIAHMRKGFRTVTKGIRKLPQEVLDPLKEIGLASPKRTDISGRIVPEMMRVEYQITKHLPKETVLHEPFHGTQLTRIGHKRRGGVSDAVLEAHAYEAEPLLMREIAKLPKGERMSMETYDRVYKEALGAMTEKWGTDFSKYKMRDIVSRAHLGRKWAKRGELQSAAPPKIGEMVELPGGKARYDGVWEAFGSHPERFQYTFREGIAKGDTFVSGSHKAADVAAAGLRKIKMRGGK